MDHCFFMCWALDECGATTDQLLEFQTILQELKVTTFLGGEMGLLWPRRRWGARAGTHEERMAVRFMFLEFLALALEDGAL
jgi:hypothetical protein